MYGTPPALAEFKRLRGSYSAATGRSAGSHDANKAAWFTLPTSLTECCALASVAKLGGARSIVACRCSRTDELIGAISIYRQEVRPFTDKQIELVQNFAAQAVIAIENTRLLNELRQSLCSSRRPLRRAEGHQSLTRRTEPVFQAMLENATRICEAKFGVLFRFDGEAFHFAAEVDTPPELRANSIGSAWTVSTDTGRPARTRHADKGR